MHSASSYIKQQRGTCLNVTPSLPYLYRRLLTPRLPAVCWASQAQLKFLAFIFLHCPCLPHKLPSPTWSRSARTVSAGPGGGRKRRAGGAEPPRSPSPGRQRGRPARPQQVTAPPPPLAGPRPAAAAPPCERQHFQRDYRPEPPLESEPAAF